MTSALNSGVNDRRCRRRVPFPPPSSPSGLPPRGLKLTSGVSRPLGASPVHCLSCPGGGACRSTNASGSSFWGGDPGTQGDGRRWPSDRSRPPALWTRAPIQFLLPTKHGPAVLLWQPANVRVCDRRSALIVRPPASRSQNAMMKNRETALRPVGTFPSVIAVSAVAAARTRCAVVP